MKLIIKTAIVLLVLMRLLQLLLSPGLKNPVEAPLQSLTGVSSRIDQLASRQEEMTIWTSGNSSLPGKIHVDKPAKFTSLLLKSYLISINRPSAASDLKALKRLKDRAKGLVWGGVNSVYDGTALPGMVASGLYAWWRDPKPYLIKTMGYYVGSRPGQLYSQLVLGKIDSEPTELQQYFKVTGMQYVLVVSGFHLSLLARTVLSSLQSFSSKKQAAIISVLIVVVYCSVVGWSPSLIRAFSMMLPALAARTFLCRQYRAAYFIAVLIAIISLVDGEILASLSFQLSIAAVAGIVYISPIFSRGESIISALEKGETHAARSRRHGNFVDHYIYLAKESFYISVSVMAAIAPLLLYYFQELNLITIGISSLFFWLPWALVMSAWLILILSVISAQAGNYAQILALPGEISQHLLKFTELILGKAAEIGQFHFVVQDFSKQQVVIWWLAIIAVTLGVRRARAQKQRYERLVV